MQPLMFTQWFLYRFLTFDVDINHYYINLSIQKCFSTSQSWIVFSYRPQHTSLHSYYSFLDTNWKKFLICFILKRTKIIGYLIIYMKLYWNYSQILHRNRSLQNILGTEKMPFNRNYEIKLYCHSNAVTPFVKWHQSIFLHLHGHEIIKGLY